MRACLSARVCERERERERVREREREKIIREPGLWLALMTLITSNDNRGNMIILIKLSHHWLSMVCQADE